MRHGKLFLFFLLATGWSSTAIAKVRVVSTIPDFGAIAREVGGDRVAVESLVRGTQDPHFVDARPSYIVLLNRADLLLYAGCQLEVGWLPPILNAARNSKIRPGQPGHLELSTAISLREVPAGRIDRSQGDVHPHGNPHYWLDPRNDARIARAIADRLGAIDPDGRSTYESRLARFGERLAAKIRQWEGQLRPHRGAPVVVYHRSWIYLTSWAGWQEAGTVEPLPGVPPSGSSIAQLLRRIQAARVKLLIQESFYPTNASRLVAQRSGARFVVLPAMVGGEDGVDDVFDLFDRIVAKITAALRG